MSDSKEPINIVSNISPKTALLLISLFSLVVHLIFIKSYGYFRDEFYYLACGEHLSFGYVDQPPFIALVAFLSSNILGKSLFAIRLIPVITGALTVFMAGIIAGELGGKRFSQMLAALAVMVSPTFMYISGYLSMNVFDHFFWTMAAFLLIKIIKTGETKYWLWLGIVLGLGLQNKISILFLGLGLFVGFLLTKNRWYFLSWKLWLAAVIAGLIFLPHILWQISNGWPTLEFMHNASQYKNLPLSPLQFIGGQFLDIHPLSFPILLLGLVFFLFVRSGKEFRMFGWMYLAVFIVLVFQRSKTYYISPVYPLMLVGGAVFLGELIARIKWNWLKPLAFN